MTTLRAPRRRTAVLAAASIVVVAIAVVLVGWPASGPGDEVSVYPGSHTLAASATTTITVRGTDAVKASDVGVWDRGVARTSVVGSRTRMDEARRSRPCSRSRRVSA